MLGDLNIDGNTIGQKTIRMAELTSIIILWCSINTIQAITLAVSINPAPPTPRSCLCLSIAGITKLHPEDLGRTQGNNLLFYDSPPEERERGERLDYILHNNPAESFDDSGICAQHLYIAWDVGDNGGKHQYSDHLPILGDFNRTAPLCDVINARSVLFPTPPCR